MIKFDITVDNDMLRQLAARLADLGMNVDRAPATTAAFQKSKETIRKTWEEWAMGGKLDGIGRIKNPSSKLASSIKAEDTGPFKAEIYSESPHAERIQKGTPELDMKTTHPYGPKSRVAKSGPNKGFPYVIVPIRHGTPNDKNGPRAHMTYFIPQPAFNMIRKMKPTRIIQQQDPNKIEENYYGDPVPRNRYQWGDRYNGEGHLNGMVRMAGGGGYFTFRVISAAQLVTRPHSWIRKAVEPVDVIGALVKTTRPLVEDLIQRGMETDWHLTNNPS